MNRVSGMIPISWAGLEPRSPRLLSQRLLSYITPYEKGRGLTIIVHLLCARHAVIGVTARLFLLFFLLLSLLFLLSPSSSSSSFFSSSSSSFSFSSSSSSWSSYSSSSSSSSSSSFPSSPFALLFLPPAPEYLTFLM